MLLIRKWVNSMANYPIGVKRRKRKAGVGNVKSATVSAKPFVVKAAMPKAMGFARLFGVSLNCLQMLSKPGDIGRILRDVLVSLRKPQKAREYGILV